MYAFAKWSLKFFPPYYTLLLALTSKKSSTIPQLSLQEIFFSIFPPHPYSKHILNILRGYQNPSTCEPAPTYMDLLFDLVKSSYHIPLKCSQN